MLYEVITSSTKFDILGRSAYAKLEGETRGGTAALNTDMFQRVEQIVAGTAASYGVDFRLSRQGEAISFANSRFLIDTISRQALALGFNVITSLSFGASGDAGYLVERVQRQGG